MCKGTALKITDSPGVSLDGSEILNLKSKFSLFRGKSAFVYNFRQVGGIHLGSELCKELFMLYGGTVVDSFTEKLDFVFVPSDPKVQIPTEIERSSSMIFPFSWVKNCISQNRIMLQQISDR